MNIDISIAISVVGLLISIIAIVFSVVRLFIELKQKGQTIRLLEPEKDRSLRPYQNSGFTGEIPLLFVNAGGAAGTVIISDCLVEYNGDLEQ